MQDEGLARELALGYNGGMNKIPHLINDFIIKAAPPSSPSPLEQLQGRYQEKADEVTRSGGLGPMPNRDTTDYIVEIRIREWMMRVQREAQEEKRLKELHARLNHPHENKPGGPNNNSNKITPP